MTGTCIECGRRTYAALCPDCKRGMDAEGVSSIKIKNWDADIVDEHRQRIKAHAHRISLEEVNMINRGLDPTKQNFEGDASSHRNTGTHDIMQVEAFRSIHKINAPFSLPYEEIKARGQLQMSNEMRFANAIVGSSDDVFAEALKSRPEMVKEWKPRKSRSKK